jgi:dihydrolipoamide dehydrogenase
MKKFDVVILGGGPGGYVAAIEAAKHGKKTALIEEKELGGTCLNRGCIPTKSILESSALFTRIMSASELGIKVAPPEFDFTAIQARKTRGIEQLRMGIAGMMRANRIEVIKGRGEIISANEVAVNDELILFDDLIIATGSSPAKLPIPGIDNPCVINSDGFLQLESIPESVVIVGGGVIGVEFATILAEFGCQVTIVEFMDTIIPMADAAIIKAVTENLQKKGVSIICGAAVKSIGADKTVTYDKSGAIDHLSAEKVIFAAGRLPNIDVGLLDKLKIEHEKGRIKTDGHLRTSVPHIYACGDINGKFMLAHTASREGIVAARNISGICEEMDYSTIPSCIYLHPQVAWVGLTEQQAKAEGRDVKTGVFPMRYNGRAVAGGQTEGFVKFVADAKFGEVLGVHMMCDNATEMIGCAVLGMDMEASLAEFANMVYPHPSLSESMAEAAAAAK